MPWGHGLCTMCDQCRATPSLSHPTTGWTLTRLTGAGQSSFCSLAVTVSHVAREYWLEVFWILLIGSRYRSAHWDLWNGTIDADLYSSVNCPRLSLGSGNSMWPINTNYLKQCQTDQWEYTSVNEWNFTKKTDIYFFNTVENVCKISVKVISSNSNMACTVWSSVINNMIQ